MARAAEPRAAPAETSGTQASTPRASVRVPHAGVTPVALPSASELPVPERAIVAAAAQQVQSRPVGAGVVAWLPLEHERVLRARPELALALAESPDAAARIAALGVLVDGDAPPRRWRPAMVAALTGRDAASAVAAAELARFAPQDVELDAALARSCADELSATVRAAACVSGFLRSDHPKSDAARAFVGRALEDEDAFVVVRLLDAAQGELAAPHHVALVAPLLARHEPAVRGLAVRLAGVMLARPVIALEGAERTALLGAVRALIADPDGYVRCEAAQALAFGGAHGGWGEVARLEPLFDDAARAATHLDVMAARLAGAEPMEWPLASIYPNVGECALGALIAKMRAVEPAALPLDASEERTLRVRAFDAFWQRARARLEATREP